MKLLQWAIDMKLMISWAVTSSALILIVLALRRLFRNELSARLSYALWGVVLLRLLVPFQVTLPKPASNAPPLLASNLAQDITPWLDHTMLYAIPTADQPDSEVPQGLPFQYARNGIPGHNLEYYSGGQVYDGERITRYAFMMTALEVVVVIWIAGTALTALVVLASNLRFALRLRKRRRPLEGTDAPIPVYVVEGLPSPCLFGVLRPAVYVTPEAAKRPDALRHVLAHELTHYAHKDHLWSLLRCLALALHWYNPLVWLAVVLSKGDGELACDEGAVARLGEAERIPYGRTLVDMVAARSLRPGDLLSCSTAMTGGKKSIQQRVARLVKHPETVKTALFAAAAVVALAVVFTFTVRPAQEATRPDLFRAYQHQVDVTQAVRYAPSPISSQAYPFPITDPDLLEEALEILDSAADLLNLPEDLDLSVAPFESPRITLLEDPSDNESGETYLLYTDRSDQLDRCYLVTPAGLSAEVYTPVAVLDSSAKASLESLARQQRYRALPDWEEELLEHQLAIQARLSSALEDCERIQFQDNSIPDITDPVYLDQAKDILTANGIFLIDNLSQTVEDGDNETIVLRGKDGQRLSRFLITNQSIRRQLHELAQQPQNLLGDLTQEQVDRANEAFCSDALLPDGSYGPSEISCFFTSSYDSPTQIDLEEFLRYCPLAEGVNEQTEQEEYQTVIAASWWAGQASNPDFLLPTPMWRYPREKVSALLERYTGVTADQLDWGDMLYLEEYDSFYNFTSDYGPGVFSCVGGQVTGDTVLLWSKPDGDGNRCELVLVKNGDSWRIQSYHSIYVR